MGAGNAEEGRRAGVRVFSAAEALMTSPRGMRGSVGRGECSEYSWQLQSSHRCFGDQAEEALGGAHQKQMTCWKRPGESCRLLQCRLTVAGSRDGAVQQRELTSGPQLRELRCLQLSSGA